MVLAISPSDAPLCLVNGVQANGAVSVGSCGDSHSFSEGVYWDAKNGIQVLAGATNDVSYVAGTAFALSADGKFIAGESSTAVATRWDAQRVPHAVATLIPSALTVRAGRSAMAAGQPSCSRPTGASSRARE